MINLQQTKTKEDEELDLLRCRHLQLEHDWDRKSEQDDLCNDLVDDRQLQDDKPVETLCCFRGFEIPLSSDRVASNGRCEDEGHCKAGCECHERVYAPLQPHVREDAEV